MILIQFQFENTTEEERELIPEYCSWLCKLMGHNLDNILNRRKIYLSLNTLYNANWINWKEKDIDTNQILDSIKESIKYKYQRKFIVKIQIDKDILIPNTTTSICKLVRFLNFGNIAFKGNGMFNKLIMFYNYKKLNNLWKFFILDKLNKESKVIINTDK